MRHTIQTLASLTTGNYNGVVVAVFYMPKTRLRNDHTQGGRVVEEVLKDKT